MITRDSMQRYAKGFIVLALMGIGFNLIIGLNVYKPIIALSVFSIVLYTLSFLFKKEKNVWYCDRCHIELTRDQIKFGVCPVCGDKVNDFRGESHNSNIYFGGL